MDKGKIPMVEEHMHFGDVIFRDSNGFDVLSDGLDPGEPPDIAK